MRAFIFSLDAFVAFTIALVAIYSLIFFSSVPSAYYFLLTQGHYLSRDSLLALSMTACSDSLACKNPGASILDNLVAENNPTWQPTQVAEVQNTVGYMVPVQFGYTLEMSSDGGNTWAPIYDSASNPNDQHMAKGERKLSVATQIITFGYSGKVTKLLTSPYIYLSCRGNGQAEGGDMGQTTGGTGANTSLGLITCGAMNRSNGDGTTSIVPFGNLNPSDVLGANGNGGALVPGADVELVKLTVYI